MARSSVPVVLIYVTLALLLLFFLSYSPHSSSHRSHHRRLKLRSGTVLLSSSADRNRDRGRVGDPLHHDTASIPFDPLIADIERHREDHEWERAHFFQHQGAGDEHAPGMEAQPEWEDVMDAEDYINDEDRFNVTGRIVLLFPKIDTAPADGFVTTDELTTWNLKQVEKEVMHRTQRDMELHDKNRDGFVSFQEYEPPSWALRLNDNNSTDNKFGWWKEDHFNASDLDGDGLLNLTEFNDFLHPADAKNSKLIRWLCREEIRERDRDNDAKLNFQEFFNGLFDLIRNYDNVYNMTHDTDASQEAPAKKLFLQLDRNNDGFLSEDELESIIGEIHPSEHYYAKQQAGYVISQADVDKDGRLSLEEMIENPYVFYSAIFSEEDDYNYHDEFR